MKTNWTAPGAGATVGELINELGYRPIWTQNISMNQQTNLALTSTGEVEEYDRRRFENAETSSTVMVIVRDDRDGKQYLDFLDTLPELHEYEDIIARGTQANLARKYPHAIPVTRRG